MKREIGAPSPHQEIRAYAHTLVSQRLERFAQQVERATQHTDDETIHDLRVSIRRFRQSLRVFEQFLPRGVCQKIHKRLRKVMTEAGEVRNRDITMALLRMAGYGEDSALMEILAAERLLAHHRLVRRVRALQQPDLLPEWRRRLEGKVR